ncbi:MAG: hypothetical protein LUH15_19740 [Tannerellaceae bacterium]|nr:hypothetical protein [Tannerellaceae bacterium]
MAGHTLRLNIYTIALRNKSREDVNFREFHNALCEEEDAEKEKLFGICKDRFLKSFQDKFVLDWNKTKGIAIKNINCFPRQNLIDGVIIGGTTGIEQEVYKRSSSNDLQDTITEDQVTALPYYFKLWMPYNSSVGVLMVQSYTDAGVVKLVQEKIKHFFREYEFSILILPHVTDSYKDYFKKNSRVSQLALSKTRLSEKARGALNEMFADFSGLKVEIKVSGFNVSVDEFWKKMNTAEPLGADLSEFEMDDKDNFDVIATYKDLPVSNHRLNSQKTWIFCLLLFWMMI